MGLPDRAALPRIADPVTGFGSREALMVRLAAAVTPASEPSVVAVFALDGLEEFEKAYGTVSGEKVVAWLADEFARLVGRNGACYRPRHREFCAHFEMPLDEVIPILSAAAISLSRNGASSSITTPFGIAVIPAQAEDPIGALGVADRNLNEARRARRRTSAQRERRSQQRTKAAGEHSEAGDVVFLRLPQGQRTR
jgi:GGDEF domain-containing protein